MLVYPRLPWLLLAPFLALLSGCGGPSSVDSRSAPPTEASPSTQATTSPSPPPDPSKLRDTPKTARAIDTGLDIDALLKARLPAPELDLGWIRLFDGQSLYGWRKTSNANWQVEDGEIFVDQGEPGFLQTTTPFSDFELQLEYLAPQSTNSGVFLRSVASPTNPAKDCIELNIAPPQNPFPTASLVERVKTEPKKLGEIDDSQWHSLHVLVDGDRVQVWFDGIEAVDYRDAKALPHGFIGLQFREGSIRFRNVRLRPILFNSTIPVTEPKWFQFDPAKPLKVEFSPSGELVLQGGKGQVELVQPYADFCLQAEFRTETPKTNSGIFFRSIPGEEMQGYECQIGHGYDQDRRLPSDFGMGGIFRRQEARAVLSDPQSWTHLTIAAHGPHFASWVEGIQVTDFVDERAPHENPRNGLRLGAGSIILQAHDPDCHIRFRKLLASEYVPAELTP